MQRRVRLPMPDLERHPAPADHLIGVSGAARTTFGPPAVRHRQIRRTRAVVDEPCGTGFDGRPGTLSSLARDRRLRSPAHFRLDRESRTT